MPRSITRRSRPPNTFLSTRMCSSTAAGVTEAAREAAGAAGEPGCVADVGAGTGYYLAAVLGQLPERDGLALDISKFAVRKAARAHPRIGAVACDAWRRLPVADSAAILALNVFAPRDGAELRRILHPAGRLLVVTPAADHLGELIGPLGLLTVGQQKEERLAGKLSPHFELASRREHRVTMSLDHQAMGAAVAMGPSARHADTAAFAARIGPLPDPMPITLAVTLSVFRPVISADRHWGDDTQNWPSRPNSACL